MTKRVHRREEQAARTAAIEELAGFHAEVDGEVCLLADRFPGRLRCGPGCRECCQDGLTVFEVEAENIRLHYAPLLEHEPPAPCGACAFLDQGGGCRVYAHRPFVCRTHGLPMRYFEENEQGGIEEHRNICSLNSAVEPIDRLPEADTWLVGPFELRLGQIQERFSGGRLRRAKLRDLFSFR